MADVPIDDYEDRTAVEIIELIEAESYTDEELLAIKSHERDTDNGGKDRVTVRRAVDAQLADDSETDTNTTTTMSTDPTGSTDRDQLRDSEDNRQRDDEPPEREGDGDSESTVRVRLGRKGHAAGHYFESPREIAELPMNRRTQLALEDGTLTRVE